MSSPLVLATVGTERYPFERLVRWVDAWAGATPGVRCFVQHGTAAPPRHAEGAPYLPFQELTRLLDEAAAAVVHGGTGSVMLCRHRGLVPIVVPRAHRHGEHVDDHQVEFARWLAGRGEVELVEDQESLRRILDGVATGARSMRGASVGPRGEAVARFRELVDGLLPSVRGGVR